ncbi:hypothetical protein SIID45300_02773 [Candidatus Magnetaquicoccaceae bacterium FCR-1]|uniref:Tetratricopeptide repeat protein n=1 Tax=Candidatus Magnetaquiglobus chichijimensis TaxID=3141448 RepID=A0ABQ0CBZ9_9PROT
MNGPFCSIENAAMTAGPAMREPMARPNALLGEDQITLRWLMRSAVGHLRAERYHAAFADCEQALRIDPENSRIYLLRGALFGRMQRFDDAIVNLDAAIDIQPNHGIAHLLRAYCHLARGHAEEADRDLKKALMQGEASMQGFCDALGMIRTQFDASQALLDGDRDYPQLFLSPEEIERLRQAA